MAHFRNYSPFNEKEVCLRAGKLTGQCATLHNYILVQRKIGKTFILAQRANLCPK